MKETEYGLVNAEWTFLPSTVFCKNITDGTHDSPKQQKDGKHLITSKHIKERNIDFDNAYCISEADFDKINQRSKVDQWDVIISMIGEYCGFCYVERNSQIDYAVKNVGIFKTASENKAFWLYYFLNSKIGKHILDANKSGTSQPYLTLGFLRELPILYPKNDNDANRILIFLRSLDDKLDLLERQNKTAEQLAETLFRQWFIEEATKEEEVTLDEYVNTVNGYSYKSSELNPSENALVTLKSFNRNGSFRLDGFKEFTGTVKQHQTVKQGDLIVSHTDITQEAEVIGNPALVIEDPRYKQLVITMDMVKVVPKDDRLSIPFLYFLMRTPEFKFHCLGCSNGTTVLHMSKSAIPTFSFPKPDFEKVKTFTEYAGNLLEKTFKNHAQIRSLNNFRDTILPKLMSGEATIKE